MDFYKKISNLVDRHYIEKYMKQRKSMDNFDLDEREIIYLYKELSHNELISDLNKKLAERYMNSKLLIKIKKYLVYVDDKLVNGLYDEVYSQVLEKIKSTNQHNVKIDIICLKDDGFLKRSVIIRKYITD